MSAFFQNKIVQAILVFFAVVGLYSLYVNVQYSLQSTGENAQPTEELNMDSMEVIDEVGEGDTVDYTGTHIMANGDVMTGAGVVIPDAVINADGSVSMSDGTTLDSVPDMRQ